MVRIRFQSVPEGLRKDYAKALQFGDRFTFARISRKAAFYSRKRKKGISLRSTMKEAAEKWQALLQSDRDKWKELGTINNKTGWSLFWHDYAARKKNGLTGVSTPNDFYQTWVGRINISPAGNSAKIAQYHPFTYYVSKKVRGTRSQRKPVRITEQFSLPLKIEISYKTDLQSAGPNPSAKFYAIVLSHYQGRDIETAVSIDFPLSSDWARSSAELTEVLGLAKEYTAYIEIQDARGDLYFDNVVLEHSGQNWARDANCYDINQGFTRVFAQVPKHWVEVGTHEGMQFESFYYNMLE